MAKYQQQSNTTDGFGFNSVLSLRNWIIDDRFFYTMPSSIVNSANILKSSVNSQVLTILSLFKLILPKITKFVRQREQQGAHWNTDQATLFAVHFKVGKEQRCMVLINDDMKYDSNFL